MRFLHLLRVATASLVLSLGALLGFTGFLFEEYIVGGILFVGLAGVSLFAWPSAGREGRWIRPRARTWREGGQIRTKIRGVGWDNEDGTPRQHILINCRPGEQLRLVREPDGPLHKNRIFVLRRNGEKLGHLETSLARELAPLMDRGRGIKAKVEGLTNSDRNLIGCRIQISVQPGLTGQTIRVGAYGCVTLVIVGLVTLAIAAF